MKRTLVCILWLTASSSAAAPRTIEGAPVFAKEADILKIGTPLRTFNSQKDVSKEPNSGYHLALESNFSGDRRIMVWDTNAKSFPGWQPPIIAVTDENNKILAVKEFADACWMLNGRIHRAGNMHRIQNRVFVYIECSYRHWATPPGIHIFEVTDKPEIKEGGIYWSEADLKMTPEEAAKAPRERNKWNWEKPNPILFDLGSSWAGQEPSANPTVVPKKSEKENDGGP